MKTIKTVDAVGHILANDITKIVPGEFKGRAFKKGHIVTEADIPELLKLGKDNLFILEADENKIHENDAAFILGGIGAGKNVSLATEIKEGKIDFFAEVDGVLKIDVEHLLKLNMLGEISFATLKTNTFVKKGQLLGGARVIPLFVDKTKMELAKNVSSSKIISVEPIKKYKVGVITTGNEVFHGRIEDKFKPVITEKLGAFGSEIICHKIVDDNKENIMKVAKEFLEKNVDMLIFTGGMSVDPDDLTPSAIISLGGELVSYGSPVMPGSMFLLSYLNNIPMLGLPGAVIFAKQTVFDLVLPRILTGEKLNLKNIAELGHGGLL